MGVGEGFVSPSLENDIFRAGYEAVGCLRADTFH